jgi:hypothetical protein
MFSIASVAVDEPAPEVEEPAPEVAQVEEKPAEDVVAAPHDAPKVSAHPASHEKDHRHSGNGQKPEHKEKPAWGRVTKADLNGTPDVKGTLATSSTFFQPGSGGPKWD